MAAHNTNQQQEQRAMSEEEREVLRMIVGRLAAMPDEERNRQIERLFEVAAMPAEDWGIIRRIPKSSQFWLGVAASISTFGALAWGLIAWLGGDRVSDGLEAAMKHHGP